MAERIPQQTYWCLECSAGTLKSGRWDLTCSDDEWDHRMEARCAAGRPLSPDEWPDPPPRYTYSRVGPKPDVRHVPLGGVWIVSEPLRRFLEQEAPGAAEFWPVRVEGPGRSTLHESYWAVNFLHAWRCSVNSGRRIDPDRVPADQRLGIVTDDGQHRRSLLVRRDLKLLLQRARFIGLRYRRLEHLDQRSATVRRKSPRTGRMETIERRLMPREPEFDVDAYFAAGGGANDPTDISGSTAFHAYVQWHSFMGGVRPHVIARFLAEGGDPNAGHDQPNIPALLVCLEEKTPELLRLLDAHGANWDVVSGLNRWTPLMAAVHERKAEAVELLLALGADPTKRDFAGETALDHLHEALRSETDAEERWILKQIRGLL